MLRRSLLLSLLILTATAGHALAAPPPHGALSALTGEGACWSDTGPAGCGQTELAQPNASVVSPDGRNVYTTSSNGIKAFARAADGRLTPLTGPGSCLGQEAKSSCPVTHGWVGNAEAIVVSADGRFLYTALRDSDTILGLERDPATGRITELTGADGCVAYAGVPEACPETTTPQLDNPAGLALSPDGRFLYVATFNSGSIVAIARDTGTGRLTPLTGQGWCVQQAGADGCGKVEGAQRFRDLAITPDGQHLYTASRDANAIFAVDVDPATGRLTPRTGADRCVQDGTGAPGTVCARTTPGLVKPYAVGMVGRGAGIATTGQTSDAVTSLAIEPDGGLTPGSCVRGTTGSAACAEGAVFLYHALSLTPTPDGRSLLVPNASQVNSFRTDGSTLTGHPGAGRCVADTTSVPLLCTTGADQMTGLEHVSVAPDGTSAYVTAAGVSALRVLRVATAPACQSAALSTGPGAPVSAGGLCADADGDPVTVQIASTPVNGTATVDAAGTVTYTPAAGFAGNDRFAIVASDGTNTGDVREIPVTVAAPPVPPAAPGGNGNGKAARGDGGRAPAQRSAARRATLRVTGRLVVRGRSTQLSLSCATARCTGVVKLTARRRTLASAKVDLPAGSTRTVTMKLTRSGRRAVRGKRTATAQLTFVPRGASRPAYTRTVTLKRG